MPIRDLDLAPPAARDRLSIFIIPCANLIPSMMVATLGIALPEIRQSYLLSAVAAGSLFSILMIVAASTSTIAGRLADRFGRKAVLISGLGFLALGFGVAGMTGNYFLFLLSLGITGLGYGFTPPSLYAVMSDLLPDKRGLGASLVSVCYGIGGAIGALLASRITAALGWRAAFLAVAVIAAADMLLQLYWIRNIRSIKSAVRGGSIKESLSFALLILALAEFIGGSVFWSSAAWTPTLLRTAKSLTLQETGWIMGVLSMANMLGSFCLGSLSDKLGRRRVIVMSSFPAALAAFVVFYCLQTSVQIAFGIFVFGLLKASVPALVVALAQETSPPGSAGTSSGIIMALHYTAGVVAPLIAAKVIATSEDIVFAMILCTSVPLLLYGSLIAAPRARRDTIGA